MTDTVSNQFAAAGTDVADFDPEARFSQGLLGGHLDYSIGRMITAATTNNAVTRMIRGLHSSERLFSLTCQVASTPSAGVIDIGLYEAGFDHDGAVIDKDIFEDGQSITSGLAETDVFLGASLTALARGLTLWEIAALGAASYTEDPNLFFDITLETPTGIVTASDTQIMLVAGLLRND